MENEFECLGLGGYFSEEFVKKCYLYCSEKIFDSVHPLFIQA